MSSWVAANNGGGAGANSKVAELLDMQTLVKSEDDVAEQLTMKGTKAQLACAKEGIAKEAERLEREREEKTANRKIGLAASMGEGGSRKWVPSHLHGGDWPSADPPQ